MKEMKRIPNRWWLLLCFSLCLILQALTFIIFHFNSMGYYKEYYYAGTRETSSVEQLQQDLQESWDYIDSFYPPDTTAYDNNKNKNIDDVLMKIDDYTSKQIVLRKLKFFHIPKSAGTSVEQAAGDKHHLLQYSWGSCLFNHKPKRDTCHYPSGQFEWPKSIGWWHIPIQLFPMGYGHLPLAENNNNDIIFHPYQNAETFAVIRDPYERLISEFYYICQLRVFDWRPNQCDRSRLFDPEYINLWLQAKLTSYSHQHHNASIYIKDNGHFTPQYMFLVNDVRNHDNNAVTFGNNNKKFFPIRMIDHVLEMDETMDDQFAKLMKAYQLPIALPKKMNVARNTTTHLGLQHLTNQTLKMISEHFRYDIEVFNSIRQAEGRQIIERRIV